MNGIETANISPQDFELAQLEMLFHALDDESDITLADGKGVFLRVNDSYEQRYSMSKEEIIGKSAYELENLGIFKPSITVRVLKEKRKVTLVQTTKKGAKILATGIPLFNHDGSIKYVISFNALYIANMFTTDPLYFPLSELMEEFNLELNKLHLREILNEDFISKSKRMEDVKELIVQVADINANILISGETGVGKSMLARFIHKSGRRAKESFVDINCGAIPESLIESELFGYERGAFTGASVTGKPGKIELAHNGTLFLDDIGELPLNMQLKLLQVTQDRTITRIGGIEKLDVNFRLIAATNQNLKENIRCGTFREDLFYRLNVIPIHIPPLRERPEDVFPLITSFLNRFNHQYKRNVQFALETFDLLQIQPWYGNIRQLENLIERIVVTARNSFVEVKDLPKDVELLSARGSIAENSSLKENLESYERAIFLKAYAEHKTSISVAKALKIGQTTASRKLRKYVPDYVERSWES